MLTIFVLQSGTFPWLLYHAVVALSLCPRNLPFVTLRENCLNAAFCGGVPKGRIHSHSQSLIAP